MASVYFAFTWRDKGLTVIYELQRMTKDSVTTVGTVFYQCNNHTRRDHKSVKKWVNKWQYLTDSMEQSSLEKLIVTQPATGSNPE
jgi:hypothetical protein